MCGEYKGDRSCLSLGGMSFCVCVCHYVVCHCVGVCVSICGKSLCVCVCACHYVVYHCVCVIFCGVSLCVCVCVCVIMPSLLIGLSNFFFNFFASLFAKRARGRPKGRGGGTLKGGRMHQCVGHQCVGLFSQSLGLLEQCGGLFW